MKSILERVLELKASPDLERKGITTVGALGFRDVNDNFTGEEVAVILASIVVYGAKMDASSAVAKTQTQENGSKVHRATINDGIKLADRLGG